MLMSMCWNLVQQSYSNPYLSLDEAVTKLRVGGYSKETGTIGKVNRTWLVQITASSNSMKKIEELKAKIVEQNAIKEMERKISTYDYDMPQVPDSC